MKARIILLLFSFLLLMSSSAQNAFKATVKDSITKEVLPGVAVWVQGGKLHGKTNDKGTVNIRKIPDGQQHIFFYLKGYRKINITYEFPLDIKEPIVIELSSLGMNSDEVFVTSFRTKQRVENTITPTTVIGPEELELESTLTPGNTSNLFSHNTSISVQRTDQISGNDVLRMQGLEGKYTQILRDGMPLYSGYAGSIGLLSVPPLDLKQVEIINGSSSALYGDGAIGGIVNFISKSPTDYPEATITMNGTSLDEGNINGFTSGRKGKLGYTVFAGVNVKQSIDVNRDGFAEVPKDKSYFFHPRLFYDVTPKTKVIIGVTSSYEERSGGDIQAIDFGVSDPHPFLHDENIYRNTLDFTLINKHSQKHTLTIRAAGSAFERDVNYSGFIFDGTQYSSYSEINDLIKMKKHTVIVGVNFKSENFVLVQSDAKNFGNFDYYTAGGFIQDDWQVRKKLSIQLGMRYDYHFSFHSFFLPRIAFMYKPKPKLTFRIAGGTGYKTPNLFDLTDPSAHINPVSEDVKSENSYGANADVYYHTVFSRDWDLIIDPSFFYTNIINSVVLITDSTNNQFAGNGKYTVNSYGGNIYFRIKYKDVQLSLGYNHTEAVQKFDTMQLNMPFNAKDKFSSMLIYSLEDKWRMGVTADFNANQYIYNNDLVSDYWMLGAMIERKFQFGSLVLNCKNLLDNRQAKHETLVEGGKQLPVFKPVWNSLDGRTINFSVRIVI